jgi:glycosyltransferase involved in cell wall biosynthesis
MHLVDSLAVGGTERVAVNLVNALPRDRFAAHLCTTRLEGPLSSCVAADVGRLRLDRKRLVEPRALARLAAYIRQHEIRILHAHSTTLFQASLASMLPPYPAVVWHDHFGFYGLGTDRPAWLYRLAASRAQAVIAVTPALADWSRKRLKLASDRVHYVPNCVALSVPTATPELPGTPGARIVCVANFRPQKDHLTLLEAMAIVARTHPAAHLLLVGSRVDDACAAAVDAGIARLRLGPRVTLLGERHDVSGVLAGCDVGVLSSAAEGLPLALLEYGAAGLASVATRVGQCAEVLDDGRAGRLVPPRSPAALAGVICELLRNADQRQTLGAAFRRRVQEAYSMAVVMRAICRIYEGMLGRSSQHAA